MAKLVFEMNQSIDGYVDHDRMSPEPLFGHWVKRTQELSATVYGRTMYGLMRYWDEDQEGWGDEHRAFAEAWRKLPKWVVSRSLTEVGPNAVLVRDNVEAVIAGLKAEREGEITVAGPVLAHSLADSGLIDEYRLYTHPVVLGHGRPFFAGPRPPLRLAAHERIVGDVVRLTYVPA
ncbi:dihydrofolate reductase family protein [Rhizobium sp. Rhizsp82]|uniref:dihydrofolate reductase family protein n=1 Tax=Rhizobium sp. Rhizsp82 TaxID=3243057 RepID=UPI0039B6B5A5